MDDGRSVITSVIAGGHSFVQDYHDLSVEVKMNQGDVNTLDFTQLPPLDHLISVASSVPPPSGVLVEVSKQC